MNDLLGLMGFLFLLVLIAGFVILQIWLFGVSLEVGGLIDRINAKADSEDTYGRLSRLEVQVKGLYGAAKPAKAPRK